MAKRNLLLTPGPTPVPPQALEVMANPIIHHRTPQFRGIIEDVVADLKAIFKTKNDVYVIAGSGTVAMEASVVNFLSVGDKILVVRGGKFGERFADIGKAYGLDVETIDVEWGTAVDPKEIEKRLDAAEGKIKAVYTTLTETSTAVLTDIKLIGKVVAKTGAILVVDGISGIGAEEFKADGWNVDVAVSGSQKAFMIPPGLAFLSVSEKAWKLSEEAKLPAYYLNLKKYKKSMAGFDTPFTPPVNLVIALRKALGMINKEGIDNVVARSAALAEATREAMKALGLEIFSKAPSNAVTAVKVPENVDGAKLVKIMRDEKGVTMAGGQAQLKGKIFRVAHMGYITKENLIEGLEVLAETLGELGFVCDLEKAKEVFKTTYEKNIARVKA